MKQLICVVVIFLMVQIARGVKIPSLYDPLKDDIEELNATSFNATIFNSERATLIENYAHWCGACQRFAPHWREIAKLTKLWHQRVLRIAAINCGDPFNGDVCRQHDIKYYPTIKLFPAHASFDANDHDALVVKNDKTQVILERVIDFLEKHHNKPQSWPELEPYTYDSQQQ